MTDLSTLVTPAAGRPVAPARKENVMLLPEAMARSRQQEAEEAARRYALARRFTAGNRWASLARFATRRADRARTGAALTVPLEGARPAVCGLG
jgi:hypothetical protein